LTVARLCLRLSTVSGAGATVGSATIAAQLIGSQHWLAVDSARLSMLCRSIN
jgi:hypothetical protein